MSPSFYWSSSLASASIQIPCAEIFAKIPVSSTSARQVRRLLDQQLACILRSRLGVFAGTLRAFSKVPVKISVTESHLKTLGIIFLRVKPYVLNVNNNETK